MQNINPNNINLRNQQQMESGSGQTAGEEQVRSQKIGGRRGYITSTPKTDNFPKKRQKRPKNERDSCIPRPFFAERPYLAPFYF